MLLLLPSLRLSERRYCDARRNAVCVSAALVSAAKVMRCIQCFLVVIMSQSCEKVMLAGSDLLYEIIVLREILVKECGAVQDQFKVLDGNRQHST